MNPHEILRKLIFFQFSSQWGFNLIIQPSDYLLIWGISLVDWYDWVMSFQSSLLPCDLKALMTEFNPEMSDDFYRPGKNLLI